MTVPTNFSGSGTRATILPSLSARVTAFPGVTPLSVMRFWSQSRSMPLTTTAVTLSFSTTGIASGSTGRPVIRLSVYVPTTKARVSTACLK